MAVGSGDTAATSCLDGAGVTLYEADGRLGGHAHPLSGRWRRGAPASRRLGVPGAQRPNLSSVVPVFARLGVATQESKYRVGARRRHRTRAAGTGSCYRVGRGDAEFSASTAPRLACVRRPVARKTNRDAGSLSQAGTTSRYLNRYFITPLVAARSAAGADACYPAAHLFVFLDHHGMLSLFGSQPGVPSRKVPTTCRRSPSSQLDGCRPARQCTRCRLPDGGGGRDGPSRRFDAAVVAVRRPGALLLDEPTSASARSWARSPPTAPSCTPTVTATIAPARLHPGTTW